MRKQETALQNPGALSHNRYTEVGRRHRSDRTTAYQKSIGDVFRLILILAWDNLATPLWEIYGRPHLSEVDAKKATHSIVAHLLSFQFRNNLLFSFWLSSFFPIGCRFSPLVPNFFCRSGAKFPRRTSERAFIPFEKTLRSVSVRRVS